MNLEEAGKLRAPFDPKTIGKLPKPTRKDAARGQCRECNGYHGLPAVHLDYVGHAATTDRLLSVDPSWTWEPLAVDQLGNPAPDAAGNLWIRLTVCGVTRIGVGDGSSMKERIGDAIRNAAMRFGVALDLWSKEELEQSHGAVGALERGGPDPVGEGEPAPSESPMRGGEEERSPGADVAPPPRGISKAQNRMLYATFGGLGLADQDEIRSLSARILDRELESMSHLTTADASRLIDLLSEAESAEDVYAKLERAGR